MIKTKNISIEDIPETWIFEHYCNLQERLHGQDIKIHSLFQEEKTPSMFIYCKEDKYLFKDFSSGKRGNAIELVKHLYNLNYFKTHTKIIQDYLSKASRSEYQPIKIKAEKKWKVISIQKREWRENDKDYWTQFGIGSDTLNRYKVIPLEHYTISKEIDGELIDIKIRGRYIYGYFKNDGTIGKIYRPKSKSGKFLNVSKFIQGGEQLNYKNSTLIICSSLKDAMSLQELGFKVDTIAPNSENSTIGKQYMSAYLFKYKNVYVLFDNDDAGEKAANRYKCMYNINSISLNLSKDLSDSVKDFGKKTVYELLKLQIKT